MEVTQRTFAWLSTVSLVSAQLPSCAVSYPPVRHTPSVTDIVDSKAVYLVCRHSATRPILAESALTVHSLKTLVAVRCPNAIQPILIASVISFAVNLCSGVGISIASTLPSCPSSSSGAPSASSVIPTTGARTASASPSTTSLVANSTDATTSLSAGAENQQPQSRLQAGGAIFAILVLNLL
ncbi:uncharacterized protein Bfra_010084 [Botrytis fragariae]|uniref:Uncharacterized protein n=1 Tax=Botrytis fragariae TaxID=1964551 RepID=A0A8H6EF04_9HELO|nr:uncharacterized protein Bfra_010084 [Botrytis fragariae]KAF5869939.1 hypothetical protein Bfra_010084 [Botrytis fragariae]